MPRYTVSLQGEAEPEIPDNDVLSEDAVIIASVVRAIRAFKRQHTGRCGNWMMNITEGDRLVAEIPFDKVD